MDLHNIREDYSKRELSEAECHADPIVQFEQWLNEAIHAEVNEALFSLPITTAEKAVPIRLTLLPP